MVGPSDSNDRHQEPAPARTRSQWYYSRDQRVYGPFTSAQLRELAAAGQLQQSDLVQRVGSGRWAPARTVKRLFSAAEVNTRPQIPEPTSCDGSVDGSPLKVPCMSRQQALSEAVVVPDASRCVQCGCCTFNCPIGIDVRAHAWRGIPIADSHCLTCSECVRRCPRGVLEFDVLSVFKQ